MTSLYDTVSKAGVQVLNELLNKVYNLDSGPPGVGSAVADFRRNDGC